MFIVENRLLGIEMLYHPLPLLERKKDCGDSTLMKGTWYFPPDSTQNSSAASDTMQRLPCLQIVRSVTNCASHRNHNVVVILVL